TVLAVAQHTDMIIHLAAMVSVVQSVEQPLEAYAVNTIGSLHVLEAARQAGVRRFVQASSCAVYGVEPTGADSPLDRQNCRESTSSAKALTGTPEATLALKIRAPSRWTFRPCSSAIARMALKFASGMTAPPQLLWVFSRQTSVVCGVWTFGLRTAAATSRGSMAPRVERTGRGVTPEMKVMWVDSML
ncbi:MAG: SDR family oxidoreductase, partial [Candidatus Aminicenantes bacterium]|nr:SDR family oxidoreductase [Candidatus Aminicenantes bacterium]